MKYMFSFEEVIKAASQHMVDTGKLKGGQYDVHWRVLSDKTMEFYFEQVEQLNGN